LLQRRDQQAILLFPLSYTMRAAGSARQVSAAAGASSGSRCAAATVPRAQRRALVVQCTVETAEQVRWHAGGTQQMHRGHRKARRASADGGRASLYCCCVCSRLEGCPSAGGPHLALRPNRECGSLLSVRAIVFAPPPIPSAACMYDSSPSQSTTAVYPLPAPRNAPFLRPAPTPADVALPLATRLATCQT
jgi:hypothetical protein